MTAPIELLCFPLTAPSLLTGYERLVGRPLLSQLWRRFCRWRLRRWERRGIGDDWWVRYRRRRAESSRQRHRHFSPLPARPTNPTLHHNGWERGRG